MTFQIKVPATSANLGLGFDSMGLALERFLTLRTQPADAWNFVFARPELEVLATDESNLVAQAACRVAQAYDQVMPSLQVWMDSQIPLSHGQGSSSSAIVAGVELVNHYLDLGLSQADKILWACRIEGHPDNVGPCVTGGAFVGYYDPKGDQVFYYSFPMPGVGLIISVPPYNISTQEARQALPKTYPRSVAVNQNAMNNVMLLALQAGDWASMGHLMMQDQFHEPYRAPLIKEFEAVKKVALEGGAYATVISGAGPSLLTLCPQELAPELLAHLQAKVPTVDHQVVQVYQPQAEA